MTVAGKHIVVTGAGRGIGAELAAELRTRGANVVTVDIAPGGRAVCDVSDADQVDAMFGRIGAVDGLVNSAALLVNRRPYDEIPLDEWDRMFAVNVTGTFLCARARGDLMGDRGGSIVNVASETGVHRLAWFRPLRRIEGRGDLAHSGARERDGTEDIRVNCVAPGRTQTPGSSVLGEYDATRTPLGRVMRPDDLLGTFCYFLSDDSAFVSGQTIIVNGGRVPN